LQLAITSLVPSSIREHRRCDIGTTVTTHLGLIKPDVEESIRQDLPDFPGWASQNATNMDKVDGLLRAEGITYAPAWTGGSGNPVLGAGGSVNGNYIRIHPRMVFGYYRILTGGAGFATGAGLYQLSLPVAPDPVSLGTFQDSVPIGKAYLLDTDTVANATVLVAMYSPSLGTMFFRKHNGSVWSFNDPFTIAQNDRVSGYFSYPTAVA